MKNIHLSKMTNSSNQIVQDFKSRPIHFINYKPVTSNPLPQASTPNLASVSKFSVLPNNSNEVGEENGSGLNYLYLPLIVFITISVVGNVLVCIAVWRDKRLQNMTNYFLFSLAIADLGVAGFVMPLALCNNFAGMWILGPIMCNLWTTMDVTFSTSSIMHLCTIQLDRYMAIKLPVRYGEMNRSKKWMTLKIFLVWFISSCVGGALFAVSLHRPENSYQRIEGKPICAIMNEYIMIFGSMAAFYIPFILMIILYSLTAHALSERTKRNQKASNNSTNHEKQNGSVPGKSVRSYIKLKVNKKRASNSNSSSIEGHGAETTFTCAETTSTYRVSRNSTMSSAHSFGKKKKDMKENERRAQLILSIVFVTFVLLWFPFFLINIAIPIIPQLTTFISPAVIDLTTWLGYISSSLNPIIYTIFNRFFREAFKDIICCNNPNQRRKKRNRQLAIRH